MAHGVGDVGKELVQLLEGHLVGLEHAAEIVLVVDAVDLHRVIRGVDGAGLCRQAAQGLGMDFVLVGEVHNYTPFRMNIGKEKTINFR